MKTKRCSKCLKEKAYNDFHIDNSTSTGLTNRCKECRRGANRNYTPSPRLISPTATRQIALYKQGKKECSVCKEVLKVSSFRRVNKSKNYNAYEARCLTCMKQYKKERHLKRNTDIRKYLYEYRITNGCYECGEKDPRVLEFDHLRDKKFNLGKAHVLNGITLKEVKAEVRKCVVRCSNCHKRKTHKEQDTWLNNEYEQGLKKV